MLLAPPLPPGTAGGGGLETRSWQLRETPDPYCLETGTEGQMGSMMLSPNLFPHLPLEGNLEGVGALVGAGSVCLILEEVIRAGTQENP